MCSAVSSSFLNYLLQSKVVLLCTFIRSILYSITICVEKMRLKQVRVLDICEA
jgi:hypothetical protein